MSMIRGGYPMRRSAAAANSAPSKQCALRSRNTLRGERYSLSVLYGMLSRNNWILMGVVSVRRIARSAGVHWGEGGM